MLVYGGYPAPPDLACCVSDPSGSAAGTSLEEAVLQGVLELVERDALAIWWYNRVRRPAIALDAVDDPYVRRLVQWYGERGRALWALDLTTDLGIPAVAAVSRARPGAGDRAERADPPRDWRSPRGHRDLPAGARARGDRPAAPRSDAPRHRGAGGQGGRTGAAPLPPPIRARSAVRRAAPPGLADRAVRGSRPQPDPVVS